MKKDNHHIYLLISGVIFGLVAIMHLLRIINAWSFQMGPFHIPMWMSYGGIIIPAVLCVWAFSLSGK
ncbi:MAG TPA: hypothetical protein PLA74_06720 [Syntrophales bacterium]|nr:hypothetical protein [Syntrophales bacterium]HPQ45535.1 hypothetical protein [Syntrophales bacterium]